ncbi:hypothetical protein ACNQUF_12490 [Corynebacterium diphtheriae]
MSQLLLDDLSAGLLPGRVADGFGVGGASRGSEVVEAGGDGSPRRRGRDAPRR